MPKLSPESIHIRLSEMYIDGSAQRDVDFRETLEGETPTPRSEDMLAVHLRVREILSDGLGESAPENFPEVSRRIRGQVIALAQDSDLERDVVSKSRYRKHVLESLAALENDIERPSLAELHPQKASVVESLLKNLGLSGSTDFTEPSIEAFYLADSAKDFLLRTEELLAGGNLPSLGEKALYLDLLTRLPHDGAQVEIFGCLQRLSQQRDIEVGVENPEIGKSLCAPVRHFPSSYIPSQYSEALTRSILLSPEFLCSSQLKAFFTTEPPGGDRLQVRDVAVGVIQELSLEHSAHDWALAAIETPLCQDHSKEQQSDLRQWREESSSLEEYCTAILSRLEGESRLGLPELSLIFEHMTEYPGAPPSPPVERVFEEVGKRLVGDIYLATTRQVASLITHLQKIAYLGIPGALVEGLNTAVSKGHGKIDATLLEESQRALRTVAANLQRTDGEASFVSRTHPAPRAKREPLTEKTADQWRAITRIAKEHDTLEDYCDAAERYISAEGNLHIQNISTIMVQLVAYEPAAGSSDVFHLAQQVTDLLKQDRYVANPLDVRNFLHGVQCMGDRGVPREYFDQIAEMAARTDGKWRDSLLMNSIYQLRGFSEHRIPEKLLETFLEKLGKVPPNQRRCSRATALFGLGNIEGSPAAREMAMHLAGDHHRPRDQWLSNCCLGLSGLLQYRLEPEFRSGIEKFTEMLETVDEEVLDFYREKRRPEVVIVAMKHCYFYGVTPSNALRRSYRALRDDEQWEIRSSAPERALARQLAERFGLPVEDQTLISGVKLDVYIPSLKLNIEVFGRESEMNRVANRVRDEVLFEREGIQTVRLPTWRDAEKDVSKVIEAALQERRSGTRHQA
ncbi:hypothetical protein MRY87_08345 [bacterium]|nr:hypothetical protein [bacterium]